MKARRVLVADDESSMTRLLALQLKRAGYEVSTAMDGRQALEAILAEAPDVLVTDISMPHMTGEQLCAEIERRLPARAFPIFVMTSMTDREHRRWTGRMRDTELIEKPFSARALIARVEKSFAGRNGAGEAGNG